MIIYHSYILP